MSRVKDNRQHFIFYGCMRQWQIDTSLHDEIKILIYGYYIFWDSIITDKDMIIDSHKVYRSTDGSTDETCNAFSARYTQNYAQWAFKVKWECANPGFWGIIGIISSTDAGQNLGAWFMEGLKAHKTSIVLWTGMRIIYNSGIQIETDVDDWPVTKNDIYMIQVDLHSKVVVFKKNDLIIKRLENITLRNGYRLAVAFRDYDCIEFCPNLSSYKL